MCIWKRHTLIVHSYSRAVLYGERVQNEETINIRFVCLRTLSEITWLGFCLYVRSYTNIRNIIEWTYKRKMPDYRRAFFFVSPIKKSVISMHCQTNTFRFRNQFDSSMKMCLFILFVFRLREYGWLWK